MDTVIVQKQTPVVSPITKLQAIWQMGKPKIAITWGSMSLAGGICSSQFLSSVFPKTFLSRIGVLGTSPEMWSLIHAIGAVAVTMFVWLGTALLNDLCDVEIDEVSNRDRPIQAGIISKKEVLYWIWFFYGTAFLATWLEGDREALLCVIGTILLGIAYSLPPFRWRRYGILANFIIGIGMTGAFLGGSMAQFSVSVNGVVTSIVLGVLIFAISSVKDFKDIEGDRMDGVKTLPILYGYEKAITINACLLLAGYVVAVVPMVLSLHPWGVLGILFFLGLNLRSLLRLKKERSVQERRKALSRALTCYLGVVFIYVLIQI